jgi:hypothetical protein
LVCPLYDAFVANSADDYKWVYGSLQTYLEKNQGFKLGLHERDFEAGKYIDDNIIDVINRYIPLVTRQQYCKDTLYL